MQILPATAAEVGKKHGLPDHPLNDPVINLNLAAAYMRDNWEIALKHGVESHAAYRLALIGYNAGPGWIARIVSGEEGPENAASYADAIIEDAGADAWTMPTTSKSSALIKTLAWLAALILIGGWAWYQGKK